MLGILFRHRAFKSDILNNNPRFLYMTQVEKGENEQLVPLKPSIMERSIFCRATTTGLEIGEQRIERSAMAKIVGSVGRLAGFDGNTISYNLRYMAGNNMDQSGTWCAFSPASRYHEFFATCSLFVHPLGTC